jgi:hypothetical protein
MMFTIVALAVTSAIGLVAITAVVRSLATEGKLQRQAVVERLAESASEEVFGRLAKSVSSLSAVTSHPGYLAGTDVGTASSVWVRYGTDGQVVTCTLGNQACFTVRLAAHGFTTAGVATADIDMATSAVIQVTARQCRDTITSAQVVARSASSADSKASCVYARRQTTIRSRLFSDHVVWVNTMASTKFATSDSIAGSIHLGTTNESFTYCGTPTIAKDTSVTPNVSYRIETLASTAVAVAGSCTTTGSQVVSASTTVSSDALALPVVSATDYASIANATISTAVTSPAAIVLSGSNYTLNGGASTAIPSSGVLYVSGPATISQTTSLTGKLTIAASGDIAITSSLQLTSQVDDMLSIVSTAGNINIGFSAASRTIEALLLAPSLTAGQGIVQTTAANLSSATTTYPLYLYGAIVARELGALGTITAITGATTAGYSKSFTYDSRLATSQPPFALSQVRGRWIRLAATTVSPFTPGISGIATTTTVSNTAPTVSFSVPTTPTVSRTLSYTVTFNERISGLTSSDFSNTGTALSCVFSIPNSYGITFTLTVVCTSDGTVIVQLAANSVIDNLGLTGPVSASIASTVTISSVPTALAVVTQPVGGESPTTFSTDAKIKLVNSTGDLVTTTGTTITVTASGGTLTGTTSMTTTGGYAEFTNLTLTAVTGTYTLTFASSGLTSVTTASFTVTVSAAAVTAPTSTCVTTNTTTALSGISVGGLADGSTYLVSVALLNAPTGGNLQITSNTGVTAKFGYSVAINTNFTTTVFTGTLANVNAVLATLRYVGGSENVSSTSVKVTASLENESYVLNAFNGHFYYLNTNLLNYATATTGARDAAKAMSYQGQSGYLATITSTEENSFISSNIASASNIWIGATDALLEDAWKWDTSGGSPEAGKQFWSGAAAGSRYTADGINFASWATSEPNNLNDEDYAVTNWNSSSGRWNDIPSTYGSLKSVVEFGTNAADNGFATGTTTYSYANITLCGSATKLSLTTSAVGSVSGATFATQPVVTIQDASSSTVTGDSSTIVTAAITQISGVGVLFGTVTAVALNGVATFQDLGRTVTLSSSYTITYSASSLTSATQSITATSTACAPTSATSGGYTVSSFTSTGTCTWVVPTGVTAVQTLVVGAGGGGGGGGCNWSYGRGGGGGGVTQTSATAVTAATNVTVVVGSGGTLAVARSNITCNGTPGVLTVGTQGGTSSFASISSTGGFSSPQYDSFGGASGVGDNVSFAASGLDTADNEGCIPGSNDCAGGGGGGAGGASFQMSGGTAGDWSSGPNGRAGYGGPGVLSSISGTSLAYGAGAFGGSNNTFGTNYGCGGYGSFTAASYVGGGCYNPTVSPANVVPLANRGGGGLSENGGSGVVIVKYAIPAVTTTSGSYTSVKFTTVGQTTWTVPTGVTAVEMLIVAGGGGGGYDVSGGGGAGGLLYYGSETPKVANGAALTVTPAQTLTVTVGAGGAGATDYMYPSAGGNAGCPSGSDRYTCYGYGINGGSSVVAISGGTTYTAIGGTGANSRNNGNKVGSGIASISGALGGTGGSGAGSSYNTNGTSTSNVQRGPGGLGTSGQGNNGGAITAKSGYTIYSTDVSGGAGGGGAGSTGYDWAQNNFATTSTLNAGVSDTNIGAGGIGLSYSISGIATWYAGGGGGGSWAYKGGIGGSGSGGSGGSASSSLCRSNCSTSLLAQVGLNGAANTGGGGGGSGLASTSTAGAGGSGVVIIKYLTPCAAGGTCIVGDTGPGGGVVFYVQASGGTFTSTGSDCNTACKYFEAAPRGWGDGITVAAGETTGSSTVDPILKWCSNTTSLRNANTKTAIGDGRPNTTTSTNSVAPCTSGAIYHADLYAGGTKTDWHLPSKDELNQMCKWQRGNAWVSDATVCTAGTLNSGTGASAMGFQTRYWSSTELDATYAWYQIFAQNGDLKTAVTNYVRPVRAFG